MSRTKKNKYPPTPGRAEKMGPYGETRPRDKSWHADGERNAEGGRYRYGAYGSTHSSETKDRITRRGRKRARQKSKKTITEESSDAPQNI